MNYLSIQNNQSLALSDIPSLLYPEFMTLNTDFVRNNSQLHCVNYFGHKRGNEILLICCIADDYTQLIHLSTCLVEPTARLLSFTTQHLCFERFEREIYENFGIQFEQHPWLKPVRYAHNRFDTTQIIQNYPFYHIQSDELHEVGVGPIHAGIIEPGHFRFICNGEQILHLEIQLGYQHRGIEQLFLQHSQLQQRAILSESIAGDSVAAHAIAFSQTFEALSSFQPSQDILFARTLALELERIAMHTADLSALCGDVAYQLGNAVFGRLRTPIINFMQEWCGNRLSKGLIRPASNPFIFTEVLANKLAQTLNVFESDFDEMCAELFRLPSALSRFERTGVVSYEQLESIGAVGMAARMNALPRDIRRSHPSLLYPLLNHQPIIKHHGDVYSRLQIRREEVAQSIQYLRQLINKLPQPSKAQLLRPASANCFSLSLVEAWRGEICHCAITDEFGQLSQYKIKDPSFHNWTALALSVRNNEISDFPICNKSFNLSYTGHDL